MRPPGAQVLVEKLGPSAGKADSAGATSEQSTSPAPESAGLVPREGRQLIPLFEGMDEDDDEDDEERQEREAKEAAALLNQEASQSHCDLCRKALIRPVRLARCRCALCACCVEVTVLYMRDCPVCFSPVDVKGGKAVSDSQTPTGAVFSTLLEGCEVSLQSLHRKRVGASVPKTGLRTPPASCSPSAEMQKPRLWSNCTHLSSWWKRVKHLPDSSCSIWVKSLPLKR